MSGRPLKYETPEDLQKAIDSFFAECTEKEEHPTITGMAYHLGFASRQALINYEEREAFHDTIKKAKLRVENYLEQRLFGSAPAGTIFNLKNNFGWKDKSEHEHSGPDGSPIAFKTVYETKPE